MVLQSEKQTEKNSVHQQILIFFLRYSEIWSEWYCVSQLYEELAWNFSNTVHNWMNKVKNWLSNL